MAGQIASFASGSNLAIKIGDVNMAFATNLSWSDDVAHAAVGGIGAFDYQALEPLQYLARGSFTLTRYGSQAHNAITSNGKGTPARSVAGVPPTAAGNGGDGNSMLRGPHFNPSKLLLSRTFDIDVYERASDGSYGTKIFTVHDCRMTNYSITFTPGQLVSENIAFMCIRVQDTLTQPIA